MIRTLLYRLITGFAAAAGFIFTVLSRRCDASFDVVLTAFVKDGIPFTLRYGILIALILLVLLFVLRKILSNWSFRTWTVFELTFSLAVVLGCVWFGVAHSPMAPVAHGIPASHRPC